MPALWAWCCRSASLHAHEIARNVNYCSATGINRSPYHADAEIIIAAEPVSFRGAALTLHNVFTGCLRDIHNVGLFLWSTPRIANEGWAKPLRQAGVQTHLVGICLAPRNLLCATTRAKLPP
jgi:hypothetical protein